MFLLNWIKFVHQQYLHNRKLWRWMKLKLTRLHYFESPKKICFHIFFWIHLFKNFCFGIFSTYTIGVLFNHHLKPFTLKIPFQIQLSHTLQLSLLHLMQVSNSTKKFVKCSITWIVIVSVWFKTFPKYYYTMEMFISLYRIDTWRCVVEKYA